MSDLNPLATILAAIRLIEDNPTRPTHEHLVSPTGTRCITCREVVAER